MCDVISNGIVLRIQVHVQIKVAILSLELRCREATCHLSDYVWYIQVAYGVYMNMER